MLLDVIMFVNSKRKKSTCNTEIKLSPNHMIQINKLDAKEYFLNYKKESVEKIFQLCNLNLENFSIISQVKGGGISSQYTSFLFSIAKSILYLTKDNNEEYIKVKRILREQNLITCDHRQKQSKTPGKVKARKTRQFSKR